MDNKSDFYRYFNLSNASKDFKKKQEITQLFKIPLKEPRKLMPHFINSEANNTNQCDILYLPEDQGYKYALVVVDVATNKCDAVALKVIDSKTVLKAIISIYKRGILKMPKELITDQGSEFKGDFAKYFKEHNVFLKNAITGRHRQVGLVERRNQILGTILHMKMYSQELLTGEINRDWVDDLKDIVEKINERYSHDPYTDEELDKKYGDPFEVKQKIIPLGSRVRVALDEPRDITGTKLHGNFRSSDARWTTEIYNVINFTMNAHQPVMYQIDKPTKPNEHVAYTAQRLQVVDSKEQDAPAEVVLKNKKVNNYIVKKILDSKIVKGKTLYKIRWKGYTEKDDSWEPKENLPKAMVKEYDLDNLI